MQPGGLSSLIFVVIIGVWAAYFIQYWVRRREHLATARSVDQFSESMRILERRDPQPAASSPSERGEQSTRTSAHAAYGQILLNRAASARVTAAAGSPAAAGSSAAAWSPAVDAPAAEGPAAEQDRGRGTTTRPRGANARRTRGLVMLGALSTAVVAVPLVVLSMLPLWALVVPVACVGGSFAWVRTSARAEQRARRAARRTLERTEARGSVEPVRPGERPVRREQVARQQEGRHHVAETQVGHQHGAQQGDDAHSPAAHDGSALEAEVGASRRTELYDVQAVEAAQRVARPAAATPVAAHVEEHLVPLRPLVDEDDIPLTWDPVPVPRPTYTMKARVTRPAPTSADLVGDADTEYAPVEDDLPVRRAAGA